VEAGQPLSHAGIGWEEYVQREVAERILETNPLLVAFGAEARKFYEKTLKVYEIPADKVTLLCYSHPCKYSCSRGSKYAAAFKDSRCFDKINRALEDRGQSAIDWWRF
jgi:uracil DNA glycosylase